MSLNKEIFFFSTELLKTPDKLSCFEQTWPLSIMSDMILVMFETHGRAWSMLALIIAHNSFINGAVKFIVCGSILFNAIL